jgi:glycosyltransferase involved in cell wall biosynthesis
MGDKPLVSVIIIFWNAEKFIQEAIESVFAQTNGHWELLLVDDGSTDASTDIALRYAARHPGAVRYLEHHAHQNRGMSASRNLGIRHAAGEYIAFLDADDVWFAPKLAQQVAILEAYPTAAMVYGPGQVWYSWTGTPEDAHRDAVPQQLVIPGDTLIEPPRLLPLLFQYNELAPLPSGILVRSAVVEHIGGFEEKFRGMFEDFVFVSKLCLESPVFVASACWYRWRQHPKSCCEMARQTGHYRAAWLTCLTWLEAYLSRQARQDQGVWAALQAELWPYRHPVLHGLLGHARHPVASLEGVVRLVMRRTLPASVRLRVRALW